MTVQIAGFPLRGEHRRQRIYRLCQSDLNYSLKFDARFDKVKLPVITGIAEQSQASLRWHSVPRCSRQGFQGNPLGAISCPLARRTISSIVRIDGKDRCVSRQARSACLVVVLAGLSCLRRSRCYAGNSCVLSSHHTVPMRLCLHIYR